MDYSKTRCIFWYDDYCDLGVQSIEYRVSDNREKSIHIARNFILGNGSRHPPCEDVSWKNVDMLNSSGCTECHPPCEDVSWKVYRGNKKIQWIQSSSLWRCELKGWTDTVHIICHKSSSLWGCELKDPVWGEQAAAADRHPPCEDVSWKLSLIHIWRCRR